MFFPDDPYDPSVASVTSVTNKIAIDLDNNIKQIKIITMQNEFIRTEILSTIDELNQYLLGNVTKSSLQITLDELINNL